MNILVINLKGGAAKSTNSSIIASFLPNATLIEIDKINESDSKIQSCSDYQSFQLDFMNESDNKFLEFENLLLDDSLKIIDVGAVKLEVFHKAMTAADLYSTVNLLVVPSMDGSDDFSVAMNYINTVIGQIQSDKIIFSFNRFNDGEYTSHEEQFSSFFEKEEQIKKQFNIDLKNKSNYYVLKDSRAIKSARKNGVTLKSLVDQDVDKITQKQRNEKDKEKRLSLTKKRSLILSAQGFYNAYIIEMMDRITQKLGQKA